MNPTRSLWTAALFAVPAYWVLESLVEFLTIRRGDLRAALLPVEGHEILMRASAALLLAAVFLVAAIGARRLAETRRALLLDQEALKLRNQIAEIFLTREGEEVYRVTLDRLGEYFGARSGLFGFAAEAGDLEILAVREPPPPVGSAGEGRPGFLAVAELPLPLKEILARQGILLTPGELEIPAGGWRLEGVLAAAIPGPAGATALLVLGDTDRPPTEDMRSLLGSVAAYLSPILTALLQGRDREQRVVQAQKMEALGALTGGISHDFNNILQAVMGFGSLARDQAPPGSMQAQDLDRVLRAAERGRNLVRRIEMVANPDETAFVPTRLQNVLRDSVELLRHTLPASIEIRTDLDQACGPVLADAGQIQQALLNLGTNALHAMEGGSGTLAFHLERQIGNPEMPGLPTELADKDLAVLRITDSGSGMDEQVLQRIFDPFFTTKEVGKGTGLGLSVVHGIVAAHGGRIDVASSPGTGTSVTLYFPECPPATPRARPEPEVPAVSGRILFVDDEKDIVAIATSFLQSRGFEVTGFTEGAAALGEIEENGDAYDLVVSDLTMPRLTGDQLAHRIGAIRDDLPVLLVTGYSDAQDEIVQGNPAVIGVIRKPFSSQILIETVSRALQGVRGPGEE